MDAAATTTAPAPGTPYLPPPAEWVAATLPTTPQGQQVQPNIFLVSWLGMTPDTIDCHVYVVRGPAGLLLIDCGTPWGRPRLLQHLAHWGLPLDQVRTVLLTHGHVDHGAGAAFFQRRGARLLGHRAIVIQTAADFRRPEFDTPDDARGTLDGELADGDTVAACGLDVQVLHTPGHTASCLSFLLTLDGARCLFTGDLIMANWRPGYMGDVTFHGPTLPISMRRLLTLPFDHLFGGHSIHLDDRGATFRRALADYAAGHWEPFPAPVTKPA